MTQPSDPPARTAPRRKRSVTGRVLISLLDVGVLCLLAGILGFLLIAGREVPLPDWAQAKVEARLAAALSPARADLGRITALVDRRGGLEVRVADLRLLTPSNAPLADVPKIAIGFDRASLWRGQLRPSGLTLEGARLQLRRDPQGVVQFGFGATGEATNIGSPAEALGAFEDMFASPALAWIETITAQNVQVDFVDERAGRAWQVEDGTLTLTQAETGLEVSLSLDVPGANTQSRASLHLTTGRASADATLAVEVADVPAADIAALAPALVWLAPLEAPVSGWITLGLGVAGGLGPVDGALAIGAGQFVPAGGGASIPFRSARMAFAYRPVTGRLTFDSIDVQSDAVQLAARGHVLFEDWENGWPTTLVAQTRVDRLTVQAPQMMEAPITFTEGAADVKVTADPFSIRIGQLTLAAPEGQVATDITMAAAPDAQGAPRRSLRPRPNPTRPHRVATLSPLTPPKTPGTDLFRVQATGVIRATPDGWSTAVDLSVPRARPRDVLALWPLDAVPLTRAWLGRSLLGGYVLDANAAIRIAPKTPPLASVDFSFDDANVRVLPTLPPIDGGRGFATIANNAFTLTVAEGILNAPVGGGVNVAGSVFQLDDVRRKPPDATITLRLDGPLEAILSVLDERPFEFLKKAGHPTDLATGKAQAQGVLRFALARRITVSDVVFEMDGILTDVVADKLVPDKQLTSDRLTLTLRPDRLDISGDAALVGIPLQARWRQPLGPGAGPAIVTGRAQIGATAVDRLGIGLPPGMVSGSGPAEITLTVPQGQPPQLRLSSSLAGIGVRIDPVGWSLPQATRGSLELEGILSQPPVLKRLALSGPGLSADGVLKVRPGGGLDALTLKQLKVGTWLDAPVTLSGRGAGRAPAVSVQGGRADLRGLIGAVSAGGTGSDGGGGGGAPLTVALDRLTLNDTIALTSVRGDLSTSGGLRGDFTARVNGGAQISGTLKPGQGGRPAIELTTDNAGAVFASADLSENGQGGTAALSLTPRAESGAFDGRLQIKDIRIQGAPGIAAILNAISVVGLLEQLNGSGLLFSEIEADFRLTPRGIQVLRSSGTGPSVGITMEGVYDLVRDRLDMQGVFSPAYALNAIGQIFTRRGEGLVGLTYTMKGPANAPKVQVNPLSALTPGMFREIFRAPPPKLSEN